MIACLFARGVYNDELLGRCLNSVGYTDLARRIPEVSSHIQKLRWRTRIATGFDPRSVSIPKRFTEIVNWKGAIDADYLQRLKEEYSKRITEFSTDDGEKSVKETNL